MSFIAIFFLQEAKNDTLYQAWNSIFATSGVVSELLANNVSNLGGVWTKGLQCLQP